MKTDVWKSFVGQTKAKQIINFHLECFEKTGYMPNLGISSRYGSGKTEICNIIGKALGKKRICINSATVKKLDTFIENLVIPYLDKEIIYHFDEAHALSKTPVENWLLSALQPNAEHCNIIDWNGQQLVIDNRKMNFLFSTTNWEKLSNPFQNRIKKIILVDYKPAELAKIINLHTVGIDYKDNVLEDIVTTVRSTARTCVLLANDIVSYCELNNKSSFNNKDWVIFKEKLGVNILGLDENEISLMRLLSKHNTLTLSAISNSTNYDRITIQRNIEPYLVRMGLISIKQQCGRQLTSSGRKVLEAIEF